MLGKRTLVLRKNHSLRRLLALSMHFRMLIPYASRSTFSVIYHDFNITRKLEGQPTWKTYAGLSLLVIVLHPLLLHCGLYDMEVVFNNSK